MSNANKPPPKKNLNTFQKVTKSLHRVIVGLAKTQHFLKVVGNERRMQCAALQRSQFTCERIHMLITI